MKAWNIITRGSSILLFTFVSKRLQKRRGNNNLLLSTIVHYNVHTVHEAAKNWM